MNVVDVVAGGPGREAAISRRSAQTIVHHLTAAHYDVRMVDIDDQLSLDRCRPEAVIFNIVHGTYGEDGTLQAELEQAGRCYVGCDSTASRRCFDKQATKECLRAADLPVAWGRRLDPKQIHDPKVLAGLPLVPLVLKPCCDGSSVGLQLLSSASFLIPALEQAVADLGPVPMLVEERLRGPEYTVGILATSDQPQALPAMTITAAEGSYDYEAKYQRDDTVYQRVSDGALEQRLQQLALAAFQACDCRDLARIDIMDRGNGDLVILEINTLPGFTDHSLLPKAAALAGIDVPNLLDALVKAAVARRLGQA